MTIIETTSNQFFAVHDCDGIDHAWIGVPVKRVGGTWTPKAKAREILVRKAGSRVIEQTS